MAITLKKLIYIVSFVVLGILVSTLIHAGIEYPILMLIVKNGSIRGFSWETWKLIHAVGAFIILVSGIIIGLQQGLYWWPKLYDKNNRLRKRG